LGCVLGLTSDLFLRKSSSNAMCPDAMRLCTVDLKMLWLYTMAGRPRQTRMDRKPPQSENSWNRFCEQDFKHDTYLRPLREEGASW